MEPTDEDIVKDLREGKAGAERHRLGEPAFGQAKRQRHQAHIIDGTVAFNRQQRRETSSFLALSGAALQPVAGEHSAETIDELMAVVRTAVKLAARDMRSAEAAQYRLNTAYARIMKAQLLLLVLQARCRQLAA